MLAATNPDPRFTEELSFQPPPQPPCRTCDRGRKAHEATAGHPQNQKRGPWRLGPGPLPTQSACAAGSGAPPARGSAPLRSGAPARRPRLNPSSPSHAAAAPRGPGPLRTETLPQAMAGAFPPLQPLPPSGGVQPPTRALGADTQSFLCHLHFHSSPNQETRLPGRV